MASADIINALPSTCKVKVPSSSSTIEDTISRWSSTALALPYAVVTPASIADIQPTIEFASANKLKIIPAVGGHGSFVPVGPQTIYLDLTASEFKKIVLDEEKEEVTFGGGVLTRDLLEVLGDRGWYTLIPNSNAVGMVGALLGGLSGGMNGIHGLGIDHIRSISLIPFSTPSGVETSIKDGVLTLTPDSTDEEKGIFNVLCGAGHGLGVITSVTLSAFRISSLNLTDNKLWTRRLIFPASQVSAAVSLWKSLLPPPPTLAPTLIFMRAPPTFPVPRAPIIMLGLSYFGPASDAEAVTKKSFEEEYTSQASVAVSAAVEWKDINSASEPLNAHSGFKESYSAFCAEVDTEGVEKAFAAWEAYSDIVGCGRSYTVIGSWNTKQVLANAGEKDEKFFLGRDRGVFVQTTPWYHTPSGKEGADTFGKEFVDCVRGLDRKAGKKDWAFANNIVIGGGLEDVYGEDMLKEIDRVRGVWDKERTGWAPGDGW
ncbi:FAD-binding domain-containing protein [Pleomassaria siparia CBS 279.74]|uniref:FAD-binding domain-containing protein n=1 Tax=Pleomassaria siparia CBS 279.74 TaxID=1314801 RepID=A0A6G1KKB6_9PLEO|nr:FAD-binding domain-containing protein [Pleomassaria siparia CBS 279.74]